jgi:hypothetical protein
MLVAAISTARGAGTASAAGAGVAAGGAGGGVGCAITCAGAGGGCACEQAAIANTPAASTPMDFMFTLLMYGATLVVCPELTRCSKSDAATGARV